MLLWFPNDNFRMAVKHRLALKLLLSHPGRLESSVLQCVAAVGRSARAGWRGAGFGSAAVDRREAGRRGSLFL